MPPLYEILAMLSAALFGGLVITLLARALWLQFLYSRYHAAGGQLGFRAWSRNRPPPPEKEILEEAPTLEPPKPELDGTELLVG